MTHRSLALAVLALATLSACGGDDGGGGGPAKVALFANTSFVDYDPTSTGSEASNVEILLGPGTDLLGAGIIGVGLEVSRFVVTDAAGISSAIAGRKILVIPETERGPLGPALDFDAITVLREHVNGGGILVMFMPDSWTIPVLDAVLGTALQSVETDFEAVAPIDAGGSAGTPFQGGPPSVQTNDYTQALAAASLPANARKIYTYGADSVVTVIPKGSGFVVVMGWDWYIDLVDESPDVQAWVEVLKRATDL